MARYAEATKVSSEASRGEIERTLTRYGATSFMYGWESEGEAPRALVMFRKDGRLLRFVLPLPSREEFRFTPARGYAREPKQVEEAWEQACRQRWRALALAIKAKLEAVEAGISCFEEEFLANIVLPDGQSVGSWMRPQVAAAYESGAMPRMLPLLEA